MSSKGNPKNIRKSVLCRSVCGGNTCRGDTCTFAHNIDELYPRLCKFRDNCGWHRRQPGSCKFVHPDEDIHNYAYSRGYLDDRVDGSYYYESEEERDRYDEEWIRRRHDDRYDEWLSRRHDDAHDEWRDHNKR